MTKDDNGTRRKGLERSGLLSAAANTEGKDELMGLSI